MIMNELMKNENNDIMSIYQKSENILSDVQNIIETSQRQFYSFYRYFPEIFHTPCGKSERILSWSHYRCLIQVKDEKARNWYEKEAYE